jgi:hypothetical protein
MYIYIYIYIGVAQERDVRDSRLADAGGIA